MYAGSLLKNFSASSIYNSFDIKKFPTFLSQLIILNGFVFKNYNDQNSGDYDKNDCLDVVALFEFLEKL